MYTYPGWLCGEIPLCETYFKLIFKDLPFVFLPGGNEAKLEKTENG